MTAPPRTPPPPGTTPAAAPWGPPPPQPAGRAGPTRGRARFAIAVAAACVVAVLAGIGAGAWLGRHGDRRLEPGELRNTPSDRWTTELGGRMIQLATTQDAVYSIVIGRSGTDVVGIDAATGAQQWSTEIDPSTELGYGSLVWTSQGLVADYGPYARGSTMTVIDPATGEIVWRRDSSDEPAGALNEAVLRQFTDDGIRLTTFDVADRELGRSVEADDSFVGSGVLYLVDGRRVFAVDDETLDETGFSYQAAGEVAAVRELGEQGDQGEQGEQGELIVVASEATIVAVDSGGDEQWTIDAGVGELSNVALAGTNVIATGASGTAVIHADGATASVTHRDDRATRVRAVTERDGRDLVAVTDAAATGDFDDVVVDIVDVSDGGWDEVATFETRNSFGFPLLTIRGSVIYADETQLDEGDEPEGDSSTAPGDRRFVAFDLGDGDELWALELPEADYAFAAPNGLYVVEGGDRGFLRLLGE